MKFEKVNIMNTDTLEEKYRKKETYTEEEKKIIMERLDRERRIHQEAVKGLDGKKVKYTEEEKRQIMAKLNEQRLSRQQKEEIEKRRFANKEVYTFMGKKFYKLLDMEREYFIEVEDCKKFSRRPAIIPLYYRSLEELKKKDVLIKTEIYSDKIFISYDAIRVYFKGYSLEAAKKG